MKIHCVSDHITKLTLNNPGRLQGGSYFSKISINNNPLYLKIENHYTDSGIQHTEKKSYLDIVFDNDSLEYIKWFYNLEELIKHEIRKNNKEWFSTNINDSDIDYFYNSCLKNTQTCVLMRTHIQYKNNQLCCSVFDENKTITSLDSIKNQCLSTIIHIKGVRMTNTSFQLELENKQILIIEKDSAFNTCLLERSIDRVQENTQTTYVVSESDVVPCLEYTQKQEIHEEKTKSNEHHESQNQGEICEFSINLDKIPMDDTITIKNTRQIYRKQYENAKLKAIESRKEAIRSYIEIQKLKEKYMISSSDDSEESSDDDVIFEQELLQS